MKILSSILPIVVMLQALCGGYTLERTPTKAEIELLSRMVGAGERVYTPLAVSTQVVAGKNYKFRCTYKDEANNVTGSCNIIVYTDLNGNSTLTDIVLLDPRSVSADDFESLVCSGAVQILDCRTAGEYAEGHIDGALLADVKLDSFRETACGLLDKHAPVAVYCRSGKRSLLACSILLDAGFEEVYNLETGIIGWKEAGKPVTPSTEQRTSTCIAKCPARDPS